MMGERRIQQEALFYEFSLERHVPETHLLRHIDRFVELDGLRRQLVPFYSEMGRPSIDPELLIRMLIVGYCLGMALSQKCGLEGMARQGRFPPWIQSPTADIASRRRSS